MTNRRLNSTLLALITMTCGLCSVILFESHLSFCSTGDSVLLGDKHKANGIGCDACHKANRPEKKIPLAVCLTCHKESRLSKRKGEDSVNPHDSHFGISDCTECHHSHKPSEDSCKTCHDFGLLVP
jgi:hypothetical protein